MKPRNTSAVRQFILNNLSDKKLVSVVAEKFGLSRTAVYKNIQKLVSDGLITHNLARKGRVYELSTKIYKFIYKISNSLSESDVWKKDIESHIPIKENVLNIWSYGFTEMFNNAIDHSEGTHIIVQIDVTAIDTKMYIIDNGVGIFSKIKNKFNFANEHEAILELSKGKLTTNQTKHTGEGIFFTSRIFDRFFIASHGIVFTHNEKYNEDYLFTDFNNHEGTGVFMELSNDSDKKLSDIFDTFSGNDYGFDKTIIPIELARYGDENLVSRSQAKRVMARANLFKNVILDFENVPQIGQAFADEIFRVFANEHPEIELSYVNANENVEKMIKRAKQVRFD